MKDFSTSIYRCIHQALIGRAERSDRKTVQEMCFGYAQMEKFRIEVKSDYEYFKQYTEECDVMVSKMGTKK